MSDIRVICVDNAAPEKATVVFDEIPKSCGECPLCTDVCVVHRVDDGDQDILEYLEYFCCANNMYRGNAEEFYDHLPKDCPITRLPLFIPNSDAGATDYDKGYQAGWNHCLLMIRGEL